MPAALYKIVRDERFKVAHPVIVSSDVIVHSPRQVSDYLLCADCERRFEQGGETWVIQRCWQNTTTFALRASLVNDQPVPTMEAGVAIYHGTDVLDLHVDQLSYFAASVFWRAAAHQWSIHKQTIPRLKLGVYEGQLRQYLLGGSFPSAAVLAVFIGYGMEEMRNAFITFPYPSGRDNGWRRYTFTIPGVTFWLFVGRSIPEEIQRLCCVRSAQRCLFSSDQVDKANAQMHRAVFARSQSVGAHGRKTPTNEVEVPTPWSLAEMMRFVPRDPALIRVLRRRPK